jgi:uncharacterized protein with HEPN domain
MKRDRAYLQDILEAISDIEKFAKDTTEKEFYKNKEKQYAVIRALEIIGEASKNISKELKAKYQETPWRDISGMRDKLIHGYFGVKMELVWETIQVKLPELKTQLFNILREINTR